MPYNRLSATKIARAVGCHPNTVRIYEQWGFLPPVPRNEKGYRQYTEFHLDLMRLGRVAFVGGWPGKNIRHSVLDLVRTAAAGDLAGAMEKANRHQEIVLSEIQLAEEAADLVRRWSENSHVIKNGRERTIGETARHLDLTVDILRNWERSGLLETARDEKTGYRLYGPSEMERLQVIRMLSKAGYSMMAILRMLNQLDQGKEIDIRQALDTPNPDEDIFTAADRWLTSLREEESKAGQIIALTSAMLNQYGPMVAQSS